jgi:hypothetical protein
MRKSITFNFVAKILTISFLSVLFCANIQAQVSGKVFRDFNANGIQTTAAPDPIEPGLKDVTVNAYDVSGALNTATTDATGTYSIAGGTGPYRVEFILPTYYYASNGSASNTTTQFVAAGGIANLGVNNPSDYWDNVTHPDPFILIPNYTNGTYDGPGKAVGAILGITNNQGTLTTAAMTPTVSTIAMQEEVGAVWGNARDKAKDRFFFSTLLKRHVGFGPQGVGGIYIIDKIAGSYDFAGSFTLQGVTPSNGGSAIDLGAVTRVTSPSSEDNYLASGTNLGEPSRDLDAFAKVGKIAFGDIDIATNTLYAINLNQRTIVTVDISGGTASLNNASAAILSPLTKSYNIIGAVGVPSCTTGELRPWALKIYKGRGYLGIVCDASTSQAVGDFKAYVLSFDVNNIAAGFKTELTINNYTNYKAWVNTWAQTGFATSASSTALSWRQIVLSDIEFDEDNNMIISSLNRFGMQMGYFNYIPVAGNSSLVQVKAYADILKACYDPTLKTWSMGATSCPVPAGGSTSEFFNMDWAGDGTDESSNGALAKLMGSQRVVNVASDPFPFTTSTNVADYYTTGGLNWFSTVDGSKTATARLFKTGANAVSYGKAIGLGDIEFNLMPQPLEIGNRVFMDTDSDGIQDADEMGIDGIKVELWKAGAKVTEVTTANGGQYIFTNVDAETNYEIKILAANIPSGKSLTTKDATSTGAADVADSDASLVGADAVIAYQTGSAGQNNHTLDFGFKTASSCSLTASAAATTQPTCANNNGAITLTVTNGSGAQTYLWSNGATTQNLSAASAGDYTITVTDGACTATAMTSLSVTPTNVVYDFCAGNTFDLTIPDNTLTGIQWKKDGVDILGANALIYTASTVGVYTYTSNGVGGCAVGQCCPIEIKASANCCKPSICLPVTVVRH